MSGRRCTLLVDADDTLWENNIYFERAFEEFCLFLNHPRLHPVEVRAVLDAIEHENNRIHGYGSLNFGRNLVECYRRLAGPPVRQQDLDRVRGFAERILDQPIELIDGVAETLAHLSERHELILFTKGHPDEQSSKLDRSGLARHFHHCAIVKEKDRPAYERIVAERRLDASRTWMVGNSPKSDINPALEAGLSAVFIPHAHTWRLEHEELLDGGGRLTHVRTFRELSTIF